MKTGLPLRRHRTTSILMGESRSSPGNRQFRPAPPTVARRAYRRTCIGERETGQRRNGSRQHRSDGGNASASESLLLPSTFPLDNTASLFPEIGEIVHAVPSGVSVWRLRRASCPSPTPSSEPFRPRTPRTTNISPAAPSGVGSTISKRHEKPRPPLLAIPFASFQILT